MRQRQAKEEADRAAEELRVRQETEAKIRESEQRAAENRAREKAELEKKELIEKQEKAT